MKVIATYFLAVLGVNDAAPPPPAADIKNILASVGAEAEDERIELLLSEVKGKDVSKLIAARTDKLASVPAEGGAVAAVAAAPAGGADGGAAPAAAETKKEEKVEEEVSDENMIVGLFD